jgi:hypothetical protein
MMLKKSNLSTNSKCFVAKTIAQTKKPRKERQSFDRFIGADQKLIDKDNTAGCSVGISRNKSSSYRLEELSPDCSVKSISTMASIQHYVETDCGSDCSENSNPEQYMYNSCYNPQTLVPGALSAINYNNLYQKCLVRNEMTSKISCNSLLQFSEGTETDASSQLTSANTEASDKKKRRRGGRKHKSNNQQNSDDTSKSDKDSVKYKTEMCKNWVEKGKCSYSVRCRFAHGPHELVKPAAEKDAEEYKSKACTAYHQKSYCPYGVRCLFIHEGRKVSDLPNSFFGKSLLLTEVAKKTVTFSRLPVFASLSDNSE